MPADQTRLKDLLPALALLLFSTVAVFLATLQPAADRGQFAVIAPPWYSLRQTAALVARAGGQIVGAGGLDNVMIAHSDQAAFSGEIYRAGAWLVLDPLLLRGCLDLPSRPQP